LSKKKIIVIVGLVAFVIIVGVLTWYIFNGGSSSTTTDSTGISSTEKSPSASTKDIAAFISGIDNLSKFNKLLVATGVNDTLKLTGTKYIVLAPNNDAFKALPSGYYDSLLTADKKTIATDIVKYHYAIFTTDQLTNGQRLKTAEGQEVIVSVTGGKYYFTSAKGDKASVVKSAQKASNGTLYIIDTVLLPQ